MAFSQAELNSLVAACANRSVSNTIADLVDLADVLSSTEVGFVDGVTAGTAAASKAVVLDASKGVATITSATITTLTSPTLVMTGTTGAQEIQLTTNLADALSIEDTAGDFLVLDSTTSTKAIKIDKATELKIGASASVTGSGFALSATRTAVMSVFGDDNNAAIGSGSLVRCGRFRLLQTYTAGNREQEATGLIGQLVSVAGTNRHNMCGLMGSYEASTSLTVDGQNPATDPWIQAAVIGRVGVGTAITTINANGILAGVAAMSNTVSFSANNGTFAAFYAGAWSGTIDWAYGLYLETGKVTTGVQFSVTTKGIAATVTACGATANGNEFYVTVANPNNQSGTSAYFDSTYTGATAGHCYGVGSWINAGASVFTAGHIIVPFEGGVYTSGANSNGRIVFAGQHQAVLNNAPASLHAWRLNTTHTITAVIAAANAGSIGFTAGAGTLGTQIGYIPIADIAGGTGVVYIRVYNSAT